MKEYKVKPDILTVDWTNALKWDGKRHKIIKLDKRSNLYYASDTVQNLARGTCIEFTNYIKCINAETSFKHLMEMTNSIRVIRFNDEDWELSQCSCAWWHKYLKSNHVITLAVRLKNASYIQIAYSAPIAYKRRRGRPVLTVGCLARQPNELQGADGVDLPPSSDDDDD
jgi:hypothetical protein